MWKWIFSCLESASISVLVNGSPTQEFCKAKGIRQGDLMAPFLFLIIAEGLHGLIRSAVDRNLFKEYIVPEGNQEIRIFHIQYEGDTILVSEMSIQNARALKGILRNFELAAGLRVNFHKNRLLGIKANQGVVELAASILNCKVGALPLKFLSILVGANP